MIRILAILAAAVALAVAAQAAPAAGNSASAAGFFITMDGIELARFSESDGLPGPTEVTLRRGRGTDALLAWAQSGIPRRAQLTHHRADGSSFKYELEDVVVAEVRSSGLKAGSAEVLYETLTLRYDRILSFLPEVNDEVVVDPDVDQPDMSLTAPVGSTKGS